MASKPPTPSERTDTDPRPQPMDAPHQLPGEPASLPTEPPKPEPREPV